MQKLGIEKTIPAVLAFAVTMALVHKVAEDKQVTIGDLKHVVPVLPEVSKLAQVEWPSVGKELLDLDDKEAALLHKAFRETFDLKEDESEEAVEKLAKGALSGLVAYSEFREGSQMLLKPKA
jgi:hypothetical protein